MSEVQSRIAKKMSEFVSVNAIFMFAYSENDRTAERICKGGICLPNAAFYLFDSSHIRYLLRQTELPRIVLAGILVRYFLPFSEKIR